MSDKSISIVLPIYNQEGIILTILRGILNNKSKNIKEIIIVLDGCIDYTETIVKETIKNCDIKVKIIHTPDVNEIISSNVGYKASECDYILAVQDDVQITEPLYDLRMMKPFELIDNLLIVTARDAEDVTLENDRIKYYNTSGTDAHTPRNIFGIRDVINRGPILINHKKLEELDYLDETFAPIGQDDTDLSFRAYRKGYLVGAYVIDYSSPLHWGTTRKNQHSMFVQTVTTERNLDILKKRHYDLIMAEKHSEDIIIE
jgi:glycosyltransferase involved in cell wall biosynthesis